MTNFAKGLFLRFAPEPLLMLAKKRHYLQSLKNYNHSEEPDLEIASLLVEAGDSVVDIGANIGLYSKVLSGVVGKKGHIYCIEPIPPTFDILEYCIDNLKLKNVKPFNIALSDLQGTAVMEIPHYEDELGDNFYMARLTDGKSSGDQITKYDVELNTLDNLVLEEAIENVRFIKCDVEGHEFPVILGALEIIDKMRPSWLIEISSDPEDEQSDANKIFKCLESYNYKPYWFDPGSQVLKAYKKGDNSVNYFFLTQDHRLVLKNNSVSIE